MSNEYLGAIHCRTQSPKAELLMGETIARELSSLLAAGLMYQNRNLNLSEIDKLADAKYTAPMLRSEFEVRPWSPKSRNQGYTDREREINKAADSGVQPIETELHDLEVIFQLPTITTWCATCKNQVIHDSIPYRGGSPYHLNPEAVKEPAGTQTFIFDYQCASCKGPPLKFMVRRTKAKIQLCGRNHPYITPPPAYIPENLKRIYKDASMAADCNDLPAAFYHLRTLIEHNMKYACGIEIGLQIDGESLCEKFNSMADRTLVERASLKAEYGICSEHLHARTGSIEDFRAIIKKIGAHFELAANLNRLK